MARASSNTAVTEAKFPNGRLVGVKSWQINTWCPINRFPGVCVREDVRAVMAVGQIERERLSRCKGLSILV